MGFVRDLMHLTDVLVFVAHDVCFPALDQHCNELRNGLVDIAKALSHQQHFGVVVSVKFEPLDYAVRRSNRHTRLCCPGCPHCGISS